MATAPRLKTYLLHFLLLEPIGNYPVQRRLGLCLVNINRDHFAYFVHIFYDKIYFILGHELEDSTPQVVQIYFDTASFDEIERDKKIKLESQISLVGGTMGLFTGFSIISGIEIIYFAIKIFFRSTRSKRKDTANEGIVEKV